MPTSISTTILRRELETYVVAYPGRRKQRNWWRRPLLVSAVADDRFDILPKIADRCHLLPEDLLAGTRSVIVFFIPFAADLLTENTPGKFPCRNWGLAYQQTNRLIEAAAAHLGNRLEDAGFASAVTPATHNFDPVRLVSGWSHKHLAYIAGLGRFGVNAQMITPAGCGGRLGSLVTSADLGDHPLVSDTELCLHKAGQDCLQCVARCPVKAVGEAGIDRPRCFTRLKLNLARTEALAGLEETTHVCGKCQVGLPCTILTNS